MNKKLYITIGAVVLIAVIVIIVTGVNKTNGTSIKIGYFGPLSGPLGASTGESIYRAFQIASQDRPAVNSNSIQVIYEDDVCDAKKAVSAAQKLIDVDKVHILVSGLCSGSTLAVVPIAKQTNNVLISPGSAAPSITGTGAFRLAASSVTAGKAVADILKDKGYRTIGILFENNEYPVGWKDSFIQNYGSLPGVKIIVEGANVGSTDVRSQLLKISQQKPDVLLISTLTAPMANAALNQYHELNLSMPLVGNETFSLQAVIHNPNAEGMLVTAYKYDDTSPEFQKFLSEYRQKYNADIQEQIYGALAYDTYNVLADAIQSCKSDNTDCVRNYLHTVNNVNGLSGNITIDSNGDAIREFVLKKIVQGKTIEI